MRTTAHVAGVLFTLLATGLAVRTAVAQHPVDDALAAAYEQLKTDPSLQDEPARHRMLMEMADQYSQYAEAAFQATADLQSYAAKVRATGLMFRTPLGNVKQFDKGLKTLTEHPAFKAFQKYATVKNQASTVMDLGDRLSSTMNNPNLPPTARNSLVALQALGAGLEQLGDIPLAGAALEGYGKILNGLTDVMKGLAGTATVTAKEGVFSTTEEQSVLSGLDRQHQYVKTPLWHRGIPLVQEYPFAVGRDRYFLQLPSSTWVGIADYDALAEIAADHFLTTKKNPDALTLWRIYNDPEEQARLRFRAELELEFRRVAEVLGDLPDVDRRTRYTRYSETRERIQSWHRALGLPLEYTALDRLIRIEVANPGGVERALRVRVLRAYPGFAAYLASLNEDPQSLSISTLIERFADYRLGAKPAGRQVALGAHLMASLPADLPAAWRQLIPPDRPPDPTLTGVPQHKPNPGSSVEWWQWFSITNEQGIEWRGHQFTIPSEKRSPEFVSVSIGLQPRFFTWTAEGKTYQGDHRDHQLEGMASNRAIDCTWIDDSKTSVLHIVAENHLAIHFVRGGVYGDVKVSFPKSPRSPYTQADCLALARHFAQVVARKIDTQEE